MTQFHFGPMSFCITPVTVMKGLVGAAQWAARGRPADIDECRAFASMFMPYLMRQPNAMDLDTFCDAGIQEVDAIQRREQWASDLVFRFGWALKNALSRQPNRDEARRVAQKYQVWLDSWARGSLGDLAAHAATCFTQWGVQPLYEGLGAVGSFGNSVCGKYVPGSRSVCVQMDVVCSDNDAPLQFIETLLHEQVHAAIYHRLGDDPQRRELEWLHELAAIMTSQHALLQAACQLNNPARLWRVTRTLERQRNEQRYGDLARAVLRTTDTPLLPWRTWRVIFRLPPEVQRDYARDEVITQIFHGLGWQVSFPFSYANKYVTVFV